jgi:hypothetical protein
MMVIAVDDYIALGNNDLEERVSILIFKNDEKKKN